MEFFHWFHCLISICAILPTILGYKVLVFSPSISRSHMISTARVADALAKDGHNVTLLEPEYALPPRILKTAKFARRLIVDGPFAEFAVARHAMSKAFEAPRIWRPLADVAALQQGFNQACRNFLTREKALIERLRAEKFELYIGEQLTLCGTGLSHLLGIPTHLLISSCPIQEHVASLLGLPFPSSYVPSLLDSDSPDQMSMLDRLSNLVHQIAGQFAFGQLGIDQLDQIFKELYGDDFPALRDIAKNSPLVFVNVDEFVDFPRPIFSNIVYIGGLAEDGEEAGELEEPFGSLLAKGELGTVFFSIGSIVNLAMLEERFRRNLIGACAQLGQYQFILKVDTEDKLSQELAQQHPNIFTTPWAPQSQILRHAQTKLFISHGGYNSLIEAARGGVPLITMVFFADQFRNGRVAERNGWGLPFDKRLLLEGPEHFREAMLKVLQGDSFSKAAKRIQRIIRTKPHSAEERLTKSIRFLEANGGQFPELLPEARNLSTMALYNIDLALVVMALAILTALAICLAVKMALNLIRAINKEARRKKKQ